MRTTEQIPLCGNPEEPFGTDAETSNNDVFQTLCDQRTDDHLHCLVHPGGYDKVGWFPFGDISLWAGYSGTGKSTILYPFLETVRLGGEWFGRKVEKHDYRVVLADRSVNSALRTAHRLNLSDDARRRLIPLNRKLREKKPRVVLSDLFEKFPGVDVWVIEGLDLWTDENNNPDKAKVLFGEVQELIERHKKLLLATWGSGKTIGKNFRFGRSMVIGTQANARMTEDLLRVEYLDPEQKKQTRIVTVEPRNGDIVRRYFNLNRAGEIVWMENPPTEADEGQDSDSKIDQMKKKIRAAFKPGERVVHKKGLDPQATFERARLQMVDDGEIAKTKGCYFLQFCQGEMFAEESA